jgi:hypothetical protein
MKATDKTAAKKINAKNEILVLICLYFYICSIETQFIHCFCLLQQSFQAMPVSLAMILKNKINQKFSNLKFKKTADFYLFSYNQITKVMPFGTKAFKI